MSHLVRRADISKEHPALTAFLRAHLSGEADETRFDWLYRRNPGGEALVWVCCDSRTQEIIGVSAAFPRQTFFRGKIVPGFVLGDFCIHPDYRSLGPALALQRATLEYLSKAGVSLVWDFPTSSMLAIYERLHIGPAASMIRFAKPLRANRQLRRRLFNGPAARGLAAVANLALRVRDTRLTRSPMWTVRCETERCGPEFTRASEQWAARMDICPARTAEYLNWRFLDHPLRQHLLLTARKGNKLGGFLVLHVAGEDAATVDFLAENDSAAQALLVEAVAIARDQKAETISAPFLPRHPASKLLEACDFHPRESFPLIFLTLPLQHQHGQASGSERWHITQGDRES